MYLVSVLEQAVLSGLSNPTTALYGKPKATSLEIMGLKSGAGVLGEPCFSPYHS